MKEQYQVRLTNQGVDPADVSLALLRVGEACAGDPGPYDPYGIAPSPSIRWRNDTWWQPRGRNAMSLALPTDLSTQPPCRVCVRPLGGRLYGCPVTPGSGLFPCSPGIQLMSNDIVRGAFWNAGGFPDSWLVDCGALEFDLTQLGNHCRADVGGEFLFQKQHLLTHGGMVDPVIAEGMMWWTGSQGPVSYYAVGPKTKAELYPHAEYPAVPPNDGTYRFRTGMYPVPHTCGWMAGGQLTCPTFFLPPELLTSPGACFEAGSFARIAREAHLGFSLHGDSDDDGITDIGYMVESPTFPGAWGPVLRPPTRIKIVAYFLLGFGLVNAEIDEAPYRSWVLYQASSPWHDVTRPDGMPTDQWVAKFVPPLVQWLDSPMRAEIYCPGELDDLVPRIGNALPYSVLHPSLRPGLPLCGAPAPTSITIQAAA